MGLRHSACFLLLSCALASCLVSIGDVEHDPKADGAAGASGGGAGGSVPDASAGSAGSGGSAGSSGSGGAGASGGASGSSGSGGSAGAGGSAGGSGGGAGSAGNAPCVVAIQDPFDNGVISPQWDTYTKPTSVQLLEQDGTLQILLPDNSPETLYGGVSSIASYDATGCEVTIQSVKTPNLAATAAYSHFSLGDGTNYAEFFASAGKLTIQRWAGTTLQTVHSDAYDAGKHAWWKIREAQGTLHFETSADGKLWTAFATTTSPFDVTSVIVTIGAGAYQAEANPGGAAFDNLNVPPP